MNTTEIHKAVKTSSRTDGWGMTSSTWTYRDVTMNYHQTTKRRSPWHAIANSPSDWFRVTASTKSELMQSIDDMIDAGFYFAKAGRLYPVQN